MDRSEPHVQTNSSQLNSEADASRRLMNATGNFFEAHKNKAMAVLAGASLVLALGACGDTAKAESPEPTQTTISAEPTPSAPTAEVTPTAPVEVPKPSEVINADKTPLPENWVQMGIYEYLDPETQATIDSFANMDINTFRQQPIEAQASWTDYIIYNGSPYMDRVFDKKNMDIQYTRNPKTAQQISDNDFYTYMLATHLTTLKTKSDGGVQGGFDTLTAMKLASANVMSVDDYAEWDNEITLLDPTNTPSFEAGYESVRGIVTSERVSPEGYIVYEYNTQDNPNTGQVVTHPVTYTSLTGDGQQYTTYIGE